MEKGKEWCIQLVAGLGWTGFGIVTMKTTVLPFWIGWFALLVGLCLMGVALDKVFEPKRW